MNFYLFAQENSGHWAVYHDETRRVLARCASEKTAKKACEALNACACLVNLADTFQEKDAQ